MNIFYGIGNLTKDPTIRTFNTEDGERAVCSFSIAISEGKDKATFVNCVAFDKKAQLIKDYTYKGFKIAVVGKLQQRTYDKQDGTKNTVLEVIVNDIEFLTPKKEQETTDYVGDRTLEENEEAFKDLPTDDLPF